jgi:hypothetical protein
MLLAEEVLDFFEAGTDYGGSRLTRVPDALVPFLPEHLQNDKTFTTVMTLTLKLLLTGGPTWALYSDSTQNCIPPRTGPPGAPRLGRLLRTRAPPRR